VYQCLTDYDIPLLLSRTVTNIHGNDRLEGVKVSCLDEKGKPILGSEYEIPCDTLVLSVGLIPENEAAGAAGVALALETNGIRVDSHLETSIPGMFACGNALHVNDLVDNVSEEGELAGTWAARYALGAGPGGARSAAADGPAKIPVRAGAGIRYVTPQSVYPGETAAISLRVDVPGKDATLRLSSGDTVLTEKYFEYTNPAEMIVINTPVPEKVFPELEINVR
jgi:hypothetical protein